MPLHKGLSPLEDATLRFVMGHLSEADGWLDVSRISSLTGRMLPDCQRAISRLLRRGMLQVDANAPNTDRWLRFIVPGQAAPAHTPRAPAP